MLDIKDYVDAQNVLARNVIAAQLCCFKPLKLGSVPSGSNAVQVHKPLCNQRMIDCIEMHVSCNDMLCQP